MPTYEFYNTETKEIEEHLMSYKDLDKFAEDNPHLEKRISATATISVSYTHLTLPTTPYV